MIRLIFYFLCLLVINSAHAQPGKYAGTKKALIGKTFVTHEGMKEFKGWEYVGGNVMNTNAVTDPELHMVDVYKKGTTRLLVFLVREDTASNKSIIADVVEVTGVVKGWSIHTFGCRQKKNDNSYIIGLGKDADPVNEFIKVIKKAWRFNPDKRRVELIPIKGIDCYNEPGC